MMALETLDTINIDLTSIVNNARRKEMRNLYKELIIEKIYMETMNIRCGCKLTNKRILTCQVSIRLSRSKDHSIKLVWNQNYVRFRSGIISWASDIKMESLNCLVKVSIFEGKDSFERFY